MFQEEYEKFSIYDILDEAVKAKEIGSKVKRILEHMLKYSNYPNAQSSSWVGSIYHHYDMLMKLYNEDNTNFRDYKDSDFEKDFKEAVINVKKDNPNKGLNIYLVVGTFDNVYKLMDKNLILDFLYRYANKDNDSVEYWISSKDWNKY